MFYENNSLKPTKDIQDATNEYIKEFDTIKNFIEDKCILNENEKIKTSLLYEHYKNYCLNNGYTSKINKDFNSIMKEKFIIKPYVGYPHYRGLTVIID